MKHNIFHLESVVPNGVGGPTVGALDFIYGYYLVKYNLNVYKYIQINQIDETLEEFIGVERKCVHINFKIKSPENFIKLSYTEKSIFRLEVIHQAMQHLAYYNNRFSIELLNEIKNKILASNFSFVFDFKTSVNKLNKQLKATIKIDFLERSFNFILEISENGNIKNSIVFYKGLTTTGYFNDLFSTLKWKANQVIEISGKASDVIIEYDINTNVLSYLNIVPPKQIRPLFEWMKAKPDSWFENQLKMQEDLLK